MKAKQKLYPIRRIFQYILREMYACSKTHNKTKMYTGRMWVNLSPKTKKLIAHLLNINSLLSHEMD